MLKEFENTRQVSKEYHTRQFSDSYFDLYVWIAHDQKTIVGFRLCYDKDGCFRALTWDDNQGFYHDQIDDGEMPGLSKRTPVLIPDGIFDKADILGKFKEESVNIDSSIRDFVIGKLNDYKEENKNLFV
ncbi:MAG: hypothetical protein JW822_02100 [Spirochaetales bacterium]|nr:hypothetical protein [Spirochaetales bacterium]